MLFKRPFQLVLGFGLNGTNHMGKVDWYFNIFHIILWLFHVEACECKVVIVIFMGHGLDATNCC